MKLHRYFLFIILFSKISFLSQASRLNKPFEILTNAGIPKDIQNIIFDYSDLKILIKETSFKTQASVNKIHCLNNNKILIIHDNFVEIYNYSTKEKLPDSIINKDFSTKKISCSTMLSDSILLISSLEEPINNALSIYDLNKNICKSKFGPKWVNSFLLMDDNWLLVNHLNTHLDFWDLRNQYFITGYEFTNFRNIIKIDKEKIAILNKHISIFNLKKNEFLQHIFDAKVTSGIYLGDNKLAGAYDSGDLEIFDISTFESLKKYINRSYSRNSKINAFEIFEGNLISAHENNKIKIWDIETLTCLQKIKCNSPVLSLTILPNLLNKTKKLIVGLKDGTIEIFKCLNSEETEKLELKENYSLAKQATSLFKNLKAKISKQ